MKIAAKSEKDSSPGLHDVPISGHVHKETDLEVSSKSSAPSITSINHGAIDPQPSPLPRITRQLSKVPRSKRRGLLARFTIVPEVEESKEHKRSIKWSITLVIAAAAASAPMGSAIFYPALPAIAVDLHTTQTITNLSVALYMLSMAICPLWWSSFSETLGRRSIYIVSFLLFILFNILSAISTSIGMLVAFRILGGGAAASVQAVGAGTIADIWEVRERGTAMGIYYLGPLCGPLIAPIVGGILSQKLGWRSTQWFLAIWGGVIWLLLVFCLPETLKSLKPAACKEKENPANSTLSRTSTRQSVQEKSKKVFNLFHRFFIDPLKILAYFKFPAVLLTVYYASITFGSLYVLNISIQQTFSTAPYGYSEIVVGLLYLPNSLGYFLASIFGGRWMDYIMAREAKVAGRYDERGRLMLIPEDRMRENAWLGAILYPAALIWYGWTAEKGVHWIVPMIANFIFGVGSMLIFTMATTMLTEFMPKKASYGVGCNNFMRNIFSCVGGVVAQPLISAIGNGWLFTGLGVIAFASSSTIWAMRKYGPRWRIRMDKALNSG